MSTVQKQKDSLWKTPTQEHSVLKPCNSVHIELIGSYDKYIRQHHPCGATIKSGNSLTFITMIEPSTKLFENFEVPCFNLE